MFLTILSNRSFLVVNSIISAWFYSQFWHYLQTYFFIILFEEEDFRMDYLLLFLEFWTRFFFIIKADGVQKLLLRSDTSLLSSFVYSSALSSFLLNLLVVIMDIFPLFSFIFFLLITGVRILFFVFLRKSYRELVSFVGLYGIMF